MRRIVAAAVLVGAAEIIIHGPALAAPFNAQRTTGADAGEVTSFCVYRDELSDGGLGGAKFSAVMRVPETRTLPDAGTRRLFITISGDGCALSGSALTQARNFADGPAAVCVRAANELEQ